ncbi:unnamed protein product, partial [Meganyctiphanes norvegica]
GRPILSSKWSTLGSNRAAARTGEVVVLADEYFPNSTTMFETRVVCASTDTCRSQNGVCKGLHTCYIERGTRYYCCDGENVSVNPDNCECCVPDGCPQVNDACSAQGGTCRKYCLGDQEDQLDSTPCNGSCKCCKPKTQATTPTPTKAPPIEEEKKCKTKQRCVKKAELA